MAVIAALLALLLQAAGGPLPCPAGCPDLLLSASDQDQVVRLAASEGTPWISMRRPGMLAGIAWVLLRPDTSAPRTWNFDPSLPRSRGRYAQVMVTDREADDIRGANDINRPFVVGGEFTDGELISLVDFIRTSPRVSGDSSDMVRGDAPVSSVSRRPEEPTATTVILEFPDRSYQTVELTRFNAFWAITRTYRFVY